MKHEAVTGQDYDVQFSILMKIGMKELALEIVVYNFCVCWGGIGSNRTNYKK